MDLNIVILHSYYDCEIVNLDRSTSCSYQITLLATFFTWVEMWHCRSSSISSDDIDQKHDDDDHFYSDDYESDRAARSPSERTPSGTPSRSPSRSPSRTPSRSPSRSPSQDFEEDLRDCFSGTCYGPFAWHYCTRRRYYAEQYFRC